VGQGALVMCTRADKESAHSGYDRWMKICIGLVAATGFWLAWRKYSFFNGETNDITIYSYAFAQTMRGRFFPLPDAGTLLGNHLNLVILLWLPVYAVWQSFFSLMLYQSLMLAWSSWPVYLLAKGVLRNGRAALLLGLTFLFFPTIVSQHVNQIHDDQFALPFLMYAIYYYWRKDFTKFMAMVVLACLGKETVAITTAAFGIQSLVTRRSWKWVVMPLVFSAGYFALALKLFISVLAGHGASLYTQTKYLDAYGNTPAEVVHTFLSRPGHVLEIMFANDKLVYLGKTLLPVLYVLPFLSLCVLIVLPNLLLNLIGSNTAFLVIPWHYNVLLGGAMVAASVFGISRIAGQSQSTATLLAGLTTLLAIVSFGNWFQLNEYTLKPHNASLKKIVELIPKTASVVSPTPMLAEFSNRPKLTSAYTMLIVHKNSDWLSDFDYVVLDGNWRNYEAIGQVPMYELLRTSTVHRAIFFENNTIVFERIR
jgi:uncharacterized membrane protein